MAKSPSGSEVRIKIVEWFYALNKKGSAPKGISDVCKGLKDAFGYKGPLVKEHLTYLVDLGYIRKEVQMTQVRTGSTVRDQAKITFRIEAKGIEFMEGKSEFSSRDQFPGINVTATHGSIVVLGDGNVVNAQARPLYEELGRMRQAVADASELNDSSKLEASVKIDTIRKELALPNPDELIVRRAWEVATRICTSATLIDYAQRIGPMIGALFS